MKFLNNIIERIVTKIVNSRVDAAIQKELSKRVNYMDLESTARDIIEDIASKHVDTVDAYSIIEDKVSELDLDNQARLALESLDWSDHIDYGQIGIDYDELALEVDYNELAENLNMSSIAELVDHDDIAAALAARINVTFE